MVKGLPWWRKKKTYRLAYILVITALGIYFLYLIRGLLLSFLLAVVLSYLLNPVVNAMEKRGTPRVAAILIAYLAVLIMAASLALYGIPRIIGQLNTIIESVPRYTVQVQEISNSVQERYARTGLPPGMKNIIDQWVGRVEQNILNSTRHLIDTLLGLAGYIFNILLAPILSFYLLKDFNHFKEQISRVIPVRWRTDILNLLHEMDRVINSFIRGYLTVCLIVGLLTGGAMALLGVEFALLIGIFSGVAELIPYFGPIIGSVPAVALALLKSKWLAVKVIIAVFIIHQLEGNIISPRILGNRVGLHPLLIILVLLAGGELYGLTGMLLAVPIAAILRVIFIFVHRKLIIG